MSAGNLPSNARVLALLQNISINARVLAFLQNMWVRNPERLKASIAKHGETHRMRCMRYALFAGCLTGRRLKTALGEEWCERIVWEESSREIGGEARSVFPPDREHMAAAIALHKPNVIVCFSKPAWPHVEELGKGTRTILAPHPASRGAHVPLELRAVREILDGFCL